MNSLFLFISFFILIFSQDNSQNELKSIKEACRNNLANQGHCLSTELNSPYYICCYDDLSYNKYCTAYSISEYEELTSPEVKAIQKEINGNIIYNGEGNDNALSMDNYFDLKCANGRKFQYIKDDNSYTEEEQDILKSENHCLNYYARTFSDQVISKETCLNAKILDSSKKLGIECAFFNFTITYEEIGQRKIQTCYLIDSDIVDSLTVNSFTKNLFDKIVSDLSLAKVSSYDVNIHFYGGDAISYDSSTNATTEYKANSSDHYFLSYYLFLLFFFFI